MLNRLSYKEFIKLQKLNEKDILKLSKYYKETYKEILRLTGYIKDNDIAHLISGQNTAHYMSVLQQIDKTFDGLEANVKRDLRNIIINDYKLGKYRAYLDLRQAGLGASRISYTFGIVDQRRLEIAINKTYSFLSQAITGSKANVRTVMATVAEGAREEVLKNVITGRGMQITAKEFQKKIEKEGIMKFRSPKGRTYSTEYYSRMVTRAETMTVHNDAYLIMAQQNDFDLVQISRHANACDFCKEFEDKIYSISGNSKEYPALRSIPNGGPPFHPFCRHVYRIYVKKFYK